jgi:anti-sigma-K factor RskA
VIITGGIVWQPWSPRQEQGQPVVSATQQVLQAKDAQRFEGKVGNGTATVVRSSSLKKAVIVTANLPAPPRGKVYELWFQQGSAMVKAGFVPNTASSTVLLQGDAATAAGTGITIEPAGGSPTPSLPPVALITFA